MDLDQKEFCCVTSSFLQAVLAFASETCFSIHLYFFSMKNKNRLQLAIQILDRQWLEIGSHIFSPRGQRYGSIPLALEARDMVLYLKPFPLHLARDMAVDYFHPISSTLPHK